ncbi:MAG: CRTAC1 family protein [Gemmataceae bacterium]
MLFPRRWFLLLLPPVVLTLGFGVYEYISRQGEEEAKESEEYQRPSERGPGFREDSVKSGLHFHMSFLPAEQGWDYKINPYDHGAGLAVGDFDGDGFDDVYFLNQLGNNGLFRNKGDGTFEDATRKAGVPLGDRVCVAATFADYDNSGRQSLFVTSTRGGNVLFKNLGGGRFQDVTKEAGLTLIGHCQTAVFFDYDNDGRLDLLVTRTADWTSPQRDASAHYYPGLGTIWDLASRPKEDNVLYHNQGDGTFRDVSDKAGLKGHGWSVDAAVFDYDEDGYLDVVVTNMFGASQLYRNLGDGTFVEVTKRTLGRTPWGGMGCKPFDFNNDGRLDLLIVDMHSDMWLPSRDDSTMRSIAVKGQHTKYPTVTGAASSYPKLVPNVAEQERRLNQMFDIRGDEVVFGNTFYKNQGGGKFEEMSERAGLETFWPWGIASGDFDNDGFEDVFLPSGMGYPFFYWPNALMMNNGNETFTDHAKAEGIEPPPGGIYQETPIKGQPAARSSRAAAVADFTNRGRLDLLVNNFNDYPYYFRNQFPSQNYVEFRLTGTRSNRDAIGAVVKLHVGKDILTRQVHPAGGYLTQSSRTLHFGLGKHTQVDRVEILWPGSKSAQVIEGVEINKRRDITEPRP